MIGNRVREQGGGYTMLVDADDIVSERIAEYVNSHPGRSGFLSRYGYVYNEGFPYMKKLLALHRICGSCAIINYSVSDLPDTMPEDLWDNSPMEKYIIRMSHRQVPDYLREQGRELSEIPFPTTVYVRNTGDNHSMLKGSDLSWKRKVELALRKKISLEGETGREFGF